MAISGTKKKRGRPKGSGKKAKSQPKQLAPLQPGIPAQDQPIFLTEKPEKLPNMELFPMNENPKPLSSDGGNVPLSENFERETAAIPATVGDVPGVEEAGPEIVGGGGPELSPALSRFAEAISPEAVGGWIEIPFAALAAAVDNPEMNLEEWEKTFWAPAVSAVLQRYLPSLLQRTNQPELAALGMCAATYCVARYGELSKLWKKPKQIDARPTVDKKADGLGGVTMTAGSPAL